MHCEGFRVFQGEGWGCGYREKYAGYGKEGAVRVTGGPTHGIEARGDCVVAGVAQFYTGTDVCLEFLGRRGERGGGAAEEAEEAEEVGGLRGTVRPASGEKGFSISSSSNTD